MLNDVADLIAHREENRRITKEAIGAAIANNYETITVSNEIQGYKGMDMKEWKTLFERTGGYTSFIVDGKSKMYHFGQCG